MDRYIQMCEAAYKFQKIPRSVGDRLYLTNNLYEHSGKLSVLNNETEPKYKKGEYVYCDIKLEDEDKKFFLSQCVYLPTQEDIQAMLRGPASYVLTSFVNFVIPKRYGSLIDRHTFDELWLMFYYFHVEGKVWDGQDWIKAEVGEYFT